ncbi:MAG: signal peptidase II [Deltaproteobacteria bacterium]|nr:signal peptidase II [Deltaproteobacteria bacterium]
MTDRTPPAPLARRLAVLFGVALLLVVADQLTKQWAMDALSRPRTGRAAPACTESHVLSRFRKDPIVLVRGHVSFEYTENCGGAFGLLGRTSESLRYPFFIGVSIIAIAFIVSVYRKLEPHQRLLGWALPLVLGGALGNFYDRIVYRYVVDFIKLQLDEDLVWPTFNVADAAITVGVVLMALDMFPRRRAAPSPSDVAAPATPAADPPEEAGKPGDGP